MPIPLTVMVTVEMGLPELTETAKEVVSTNVSVPFSLVLRVVSADPSGPRVENSASYSVGAAAKYVPAAVGRGFSGVPELPVVLTAKLLNKRSVVVHPPAVTRVDTLSVPAVASGTFALGLAPPVKAALAVPVAVGQALGNAKAVIAVKARPMNSFIAKRPPKQLHTPSIIGLFIS